MTQTDSTKSETQTLTEYTEDGKPLAKVSMDYRFRLERSRDYLQRLIENRAPQRATDDDELYAAIKDLKGRIESRVTDEIAVGWENIRIALTKESFDAREVGEKFSEAGNILQLLWEYATARGQEHPKNPHEQYRANGGEVTLYYRTSTTRETAVDAPPHRKEASIRLNKLHEKKKRRAESV